MMKISIIISEFVYVLKPRSQITSQHSVPWFYLIGCQGGHIKCYTIKQVIDSNVIVNCLVTVSRSTVVSRLVWGKISPNYERYLLAIHSSCVIIVLLIIQHLELHQMPRIHLIPEDTARHCDRKQPWVWECGRYTVVTDDQGSIKIFMSNVIIILDGLITQTMEFIWAWICHLNYNFFSSFSFFLNFLKR